MRTITNYKELMAVKAGLQHALDDQKRHMGEEIHAITDKFAGLHRFLAMVGIVSPPNGTRNGKKNSLLRMGVDAGIDLVVGQKLAKAGWAAKVAVPFVLRNVSSLIMNLLGRRKVAQHSA